MSAERKALSSMETGGERDEETRADKEGGGRRRGVGRMEEEEEGQDL